MKQIFAITIADNDFENVFLPLLNYIGEQHLELTKEQLLDLLKELCNGFYLLYHIKENRYPVHCVKNYLISRLKIENIYFGEEVSTYIKESNGWHNYEFWIKEPYKPAYAL
jgi:hypothetical protein